MYIRDFLTSILTLQKVLEKNYENYIKKIINIPMILVEKNEEKIDILKLITLDV